MHENLPSDFTFVCNLNFYKDKQVVMCILCEKLKSRVLPLSWYVIYRLRFDELECRSCLGLSLQPQCISRLISP